MFLHEGGSGPVCQRISLATIDRVEAARLGQARPGQRAAGGFNGQIAMYLAKHVGGWRSTARIGRLYNGPDCLPCFEKDREPSGVALGRG